jgi:hypothetical protein
MKKHCPLYDMYRVSYVICRIPESRNTKEPQVNNYGVSLVDMCAASDLCILNGYTIGGHHLFTYNGCSVVNYVSIVCFEINIIYYINRLNIIVATSASIEIK